MRRVKQEAADEYVYNLGGIIHYYAAYGGRPDVTPAKIFSSDYGLYWFDYASGYSTIFGEFVGNQSRQTTIALRQRSRAIFQSALGNQHNVEVRPSALP